MLYQYVACNTGALLLLFLHSCSVAAAQDRFAAMEPLQPLEARWYPPLAIDPILRRQNQNVLPCDPDHHNCLDVGAAGACCPNSRYCYINSTGVPQCCSIGQTCDKDTQCKPSQFQCNITSTVTRTATSGTAVLSTALIPACCDRRCPQTSSFLCPESMGGGCCRYGQTCASGRQCIAAVTQAPTAFVPEVPEGCTTSQITCRDGGCCSLGRSCTSSNGMRYCVTAPALPTNGSLTPAPQDQGLSSGAKAGIAVGVVLGSAIVIGIATWLCIRKRRYGTVSFRSQSVSQIHGSGGRAAGRGSIPMIIGGGGGGTVGSERGGPLSGPASEVHYPTADYFGPDAVAGPYTDLDSPTTQRDPTPGFDRGVPVEPDGPSHIVAPVELDSGRSQSGQSDVTSPSHISNMDARTMSMYLQTPLGAQSVDNRYELYGSDTATPLGGPGDQQQPSAGQQSHVTPDQK